MSKKTTVKDFKLLSETLENEFKQNGNIAKMYNKLFEICKSGGNTDQECKLNTNQAQLIISEIWKMRHSSKQNVLNAIVKDVVDTTKPLQVTLEHKEAMKISNDMNHQHDLYVASTTGSNSDKKKVKQVYDKAKEFGKNINKNYNDYYNVWNQMKELEQIYIKKYDEYYGYKQTYQDKSDEVPLDVQKQATEIYTYLNENLIPKFKKLNTKLNTLIQQRDKLLTDFYNLYQSLSVEEGQTISVPLVAFDIHKKIYSKSGSRSKPAVRVNKCIQKSWSDAMKEGFNTTLYAPCHIMKQNEVVPKCLSKYDWPYIEYEPNVFDAWDSQIVYSEWVNSCMSLENERIPYIGV